MPEYYEVEVSLVGVRHRVWRRFQLRAEATFLDLHRAIQDACGWWDYHLWRFQTLDWEGIAGLPDEESDDPDAANVTLASYFGEEGRCRYVYDFGDFWEHDVKAKRVEVDAEFRRRLLAGRRAFPPEDCGGIPGYEECVEVASGRRKDPELAEWLGDWHPDDFDLQLEAQAFDE